MQTTIALTTLTLIWATITYLEHKHPEKLKPKTPPHQCNCPHCEYKGQHIK